MINSKIKYIFYFIIMNIDNIIKNGYPNIDKIDIKDKEKLGIVYTPFFFIEKMFSLLPNEIFKNPKVKWLDMGSGTGNFTIILYIKLYNSLSDIILNNDERKNHIINNMIFMSEIKSDHIIKLKNLFGNTCNIYNNFLDINNNFDIIIGNPPYNIGKIKTPSNNKISKKNDGISIWHKFIHKSLEILNNKGYLLTIIPAIWLKPDKFNVHKLLTQYNIIKLHNLTNKETNKLFNYNAQIPTTYFLLKKELTNIKHINIFDNLLNKYSLFNYKNNLSIPLFGIDIINKLLLLTEKFNTLKVIKTNSPSNKSKFNEIENNQFLYCNIKTCKLNNLQPYIIYNYSNIPQIGYNYPKLILAHKMYGFPFLDENGFIGISTRDNYIIKDYSIENLKIIQKFLSSKLAIFIFLTTSYRMKYLEKYCFNYIPDIINIINYYNIQDKKNFDIYNYLSLNSNEKNIINNYSKNYKFFI